MSLIIKGMKLPKSCYDCDLFSGEGFLCPLVIETNYNWSLEAMYKYKRVDECPLVEIPTPHGRLIDADELVWFIDNHIAAGKKWVEFETIKDMINSLPTIIEAEVSE